jgi:hypothetical protein
VFIQEADYLDVLSEYSRLNGNSFTGKVPAFNNLTNLLVL